MLQQPYTMTLFSELAVRQLWLYQWYFHDGRGSIPCVELWDISSLRIYGSDSWNRRIHLCICERFVLL